MSEQPHYRILCITPGRQHFLDRPYFTRVDAQLALTALKRFVPDARFEIEASS